MIQTRVTVTLIQDGELLDAFTWIADDPEGKKAGFINYTLSENEFKDES